MLQKLVGLKFRCQFDGCDQVLAYKDYISHVLNCPISKLIAKAADHTECETKIKELKDKI